MHDLQTLEELNRREADRATRRTEERLRNELNGLAHRIAHEATFGAVDPDLALEYEVTREALRQHTEAKCTQA